jgi:DNA repair protein RadC
MNTTYMRRAIVPIISHAKNPARDYVLTIHDLPLENKPRERLMREGASVLTVSELFAVILNVGTKKEGVMSMAHRMMKEYGEKSLLSKRTPKELAAELEIPVGKACQIIAAVELGRRLFERNPNGTKIIRNAKDVHAYAKSMAELPKEHLRGIYLNSHYKVIHDEVISIGTIDANIIHPREVFRPALEYAAAAVILVHNHPSGVLTPSEADITVTAQLVEAGKLIGIELIDHVIISRLGFSSMLE